MSSYVGKSAASGYRAAPSIRWRGRPCSGQGAPTSSWRQRARADRATRSSSLGSPSSPHHHHASLGTACSRPPRYRFRSGAQGGGSARLFPDSVNATFPISGCRYGGLGAARRQEVEATENERSSRWSWRFRMETDAAMVTWGDGHGGTYRDERPMTSQWQYRG
ncbi:hypothetical protein E2562_022537 [Oryza meyeriana var. granulata]|uniref:Uncharacterized protein n=1 Tax=Oryza meyeriana var. granulata TaxID=110450 RepID=A0A6G1FB20_9ORYZ|nr:hypothetical protein E2562_022537 [Oryza meyeriana var. granulata]